jgi:quinol monooxygenase YgiN
MPDIGASSSTSTVRRLARFRAVDDQAAKQVTDALRTVADGIAAEPGHATYDVFAVDGDPTLLYVLETWASAADADRHARRVVDDGSVDRVLPLLGERLETMTLTTVASKHVEGAAA